MATSNVTPSATVSTEDIVVKKTVYDLASFEKKTLEKTVKFTPVSVENAIAEGLQRVNGDKEKLAEYINDGLRRAVLLDRSQIELTETQCPVGIVNGFVKNFLPMFAKEKTKKDQRAKAIAFVRGNEGLLTALKTYAAAVLAAGAEVEDDDTDGEENEQK